MTFSDINFLLIFILIYVPIYMLLPSKAKPWLLLLGSMGFYALNDIWVMPVLLVNIVIVFISGILEDHFFDRIELRKFITKFGIGLQICLMVISILFFKNHTFIGIGFFTIQFIGYYLDVYRNTIVPCRNPLTFANYIFFFPKVLQGPIVSFKDLEKELTSPERVSLAKLEKGMRTFILGMSFKVILADRLYYLWNGVQTVGFQSISTPLAWLSMYSYSMQLYFDFQGYSLMAIGVAQMLGFSLPTNFKSPYLSQSVSEFYRRWHMTLGEWFKNHVYIPLGGSRSGTKKTIFNLAAVWVLTGLWHGLTMNFMFWALTLLLFIILEKTLLKKFFKSEHIGVKIARHIYVLIVIPMTWMMFAIGNIEQMGIFFTRLFNLTSICEPLNVNSNDIFNYFKDYWIFIIGGMICCLPLMEEVLVKTRIYMTRFISFALFWLCVYMIMKNGNNPFMYINF